MMLSDAALDEILGKATSVSLTDKDVVFGRGGFTNRHPANIEYLKLLSEHEQAYMCCQRKFQKLLSLCIIHQLRCKGARFLKKNEKSGTWQTVKLSQCRLKISQRLRERAPFIKLEQMKAARVGVSTTRMSLVQAVAAAPAPAMLLQAPLLQQPVTTTQQPARMIQQRASPVNHPVQVIDISCSTTADESSVGGVSSISVGEDASLVGEEDRCIEPLEPVDCSIFDTTLLQSWAQRQVQQPKRRLDDCYAYCSEEPQSKRPRKVSLNDDDFDNLLLQDPAILEDDDISVVGLNKENDLEFPELEGLDDIVVNPYNVSPEDDMFEFLQVLF